MWRDYSAHRGICSTPASMPTVSNTPGVFCQKPSCDVETFFHALAHPILGERMVGLQPPRQLPGWAGLITLLVMSKIARRGAAMEVDFADGDPVPVAGKLALTRHLTQCLAGDLLARTPAQLELALAVLQAAHGFDHQTLQCLLPGELAAWLVALISKPLRTNSARGVPRDRVPGRNARNVSPVGQLLCQRRQLGLFDQATRSRSLRPVHRASPEGLCSGWNPRNAIAIAQAPFSLFILRINFCGDTARPSGADYRQDADSLAQRLQLYSRPILDAAERNIDSDKPRISTS